MTKSASPYEHFHIKTAARGATGNESASEAQNGSRWMYFEILSIKFTKYAPYNRSSIFWPEFRDGTSWSTFHLRGCHCRYGLTHQLLMRNLIKLLRGSVAGKSAVAGRRLEPVPLMLNDSNTRRPVVKAAAGRMRRRLLRARDRERQAVTPTTATAADQPATMWMSGPG